jgi:hypothetical protein
MPPARLASRNSSPRNSRPSASTSAARREARSSRLLAATRRHMSRRAALEAFGHRATLFHHLDASGGAQRPSNCSRGIELQFHPSPLTVCFSPLLLLSRRRAFGRYSRADGGSMVHPGRDERPGPARCSSRAAAGAFASFCRPPCACCCCRLRSPPPAGLLLAWEAKLGCLMGSVDGLGPVGAAGAPLARLLRLRTTLPCASLETLCCVMPRPSL